MTELIKPQAPNAQKEEGVLDLALPIHLRRISDLDIPAVCSWVSSSQELTRISGDQADKLTPAILQRWCDESIDAVVLEFNDSPATFCTLSTREYDLPRGSVELCHLVTAPNDRRRYFATATISSMRILAAHHHFKHLVGRVVPENMPALSFVSYVRWKEVTDTARLFDSCFKWFSYEIK